MKKIQQTQPKKKKNNLNNYREWLENQNFSPITIKVYVNTTRRYGEKNVLDSKTITEFFKKKVGKLAAKSLITY